MLIRAVTVVCGLWRRQAEAADARMTPAERTTLLKTLCESGQEFLAALEGVTEEQWHWKPAPGKWSVGETAEHAVLFAEVYFAIVRKALESPPNGSWQRDTFGKTILLGMFVAPRIVNAKAPEKLAPKGNLTLSQVKERFVRQHDELVKFVAETSLQLKQHTVENVSFGTLNCYQLLLYAPLHTMRHDKQIAELKELAAAGVDQRRLTPLKLLILIGFAAVAWFCAANYIRVAGPAGEFSGTRGPVTYAVTALVTIPLNWLTRKLVGLPRKEMLTCVAVTASAATLLDGVAMSHFPGIYGSNPAAMATGAAWLLWAIGVALGLALFTTARAR